MVTMLRLFAVVLTLVAAVEAKVIPEEVVPGTPFRRYVTTLRDKQRVTFYLSTAQPVTAKRPLVVWVQGTGCESLFQKGPGEQMIAGQQSLLERATGGSAIVLAVEKPGVEYLDKQQDAGNSLECRPEFRERYTLDNWAGSIAAAIQSTRELPEVDARHTLVIGHSEGALVAMRVSNLVPGVTHVASLSGGGPSHLFVVMEFMRRNGFDPELAVYPCWRAILHDPDSATKFCWGQTHRQWSSFWKTTLVKECLQSKARLYLMHGSADGQNPIAAFDVLRAELMTAGRDAVFDRIEGASHTLDRSGEWMPLGMIRAFDRVLAWFRREIS